MTTDKEIEYHWRELKKLLMIKDYTLQDLLSDCNRKRRLSEYWEKQALGITDNDA